MNEEDPPIPSPSTSAKNALLEMRRKKQQEYEAKLLEEADIEDPMP